MVIMASEKTVSLRAHLEHNCFCNTTVVFYHFELDSYINISYRNIEHITWRTSSNHKITHAFNKNRRFEVVLH